MYRGVFLTRFKREYRHTLISQQQVVVRYSMYARPRVLRRSAKVPTGHRYCLGNAPSFIRRRNGAFSCFAAHGTVTHGRGAPAPLRLAVIFTLVLFLPFGAPALRGKASLPLTNNSTCYKGFTSGFAALVTVPFFVASPLATPTAMPRCSKRAGLLRPKPLWWFVGLFYASALPAFIGPCFASCYF